MEVVVVPSALPVDFNFDSNCSSPYITAPSSPQRFGNLFLTVLPSPSSSVFNDATPRSRIHHTNASQDSQFLDYDDDDDFEFDFSGQLDRASLSADELFDGGKIRPLKPPPGFESSANSTVTSPRPPKSKTSQETRTERGRERTISSSSSSSSSKSPNYVHKGSRSLSPLRVSDLILDQEDSSNDSKRPPETTTINSSKSSFLSAISFSSKVYKKWKLKDLLLFRSASEGRAIGKDQLTKYGLLSKRSEVAAEDDAKNASFRSTESSVGSTSRRRGRVSAHEMHYTAKRAVSEEMKRKTFLPYKHGLFGCLGFNHDISKSIGSLTRG